MADFRLDQLTQTTPNGSELMLVQNTSNSSYYKAALSNAYSKVAVSASGNTAGTVSPILNGTAVLAGGNNITLSQSGNSISIIGNSGGGGSVNLSAGSTSNNLTNFVFANANGLSFGLNGSTVTGSYTTPTQSVQTQGMVSVNGSTGNISLATGSSLSSSSNGSTITFGLASNITTALQSAGAYLTTAMASNRGTDFVQATAAFAGTNASGTIASNGISVSVNAGGGGGAALKGSGTYTQNTGTVEFANSNGITFGLSNNGTMTASHNGITSQSIQTQNMVSVNGSTGNISLATGSSLSSSSNGSTITFGLASNITTALQSAGAYLTTAMQSNNPVVQSINGSSGTFSLMTASSLSSSRNGNSISFGLASNITTALQSAGAYLTTARASTDAIGLNTAVSNATITANSSGLSIDGRGYAGTNTTFNGANISGSITQNSNGLNLSLSVAPGGGGADGYNILAAGTQTANTTGTVSLANSNGITFGMSNSSVITASHNGITQQSTQPVALSGSNGSFNFSTATFGNLNGLSFYTSNGSLVASYTVPTQSVQTQNMVSVEGSTGNIDFANANGITFGFNNSTITASHNGLTSQSNQAFSAGGGSSAFQTLNFRNANGISFSNSNGSVEASYTVPSVPSVTQYFSNTATTFNGTNISGSITNNTNGIRLDLSVDPSGGAGDGVNILAAGTQTANTTGTVEFVNSNGITFGMSNSSRITASHNGITQQSTQPVALSGSNGSFNFSTATFGNLNGLSFYTSNGSMVGSYTVPTQSVQTQNMVSVEGSTGNIDFANANGITFGFNASTITASHNGLTSQSNQAASGSNGSFTFQTLSFNNANGVSFGSNGSAITASYTVPTVTNSSLTMQAGGSTLSSVSRVAFGDGNGVSFGASTSNNGSITITASHNGLTSQSNQAFSASGGSSAFQTLNFANSNGLTFSNSNGSVIGSYTVPTVTQYFSATNTTFNGTNVSGSLTLNTNGLRVDISAGAGGGVTPVASASNGSFSFTTLGFSNANNVTFGTSAGSIITASVAAPGAAAEQNAVNLLGANTAGNTTATGSTIGWSGQNLTLSGANASQIVISAPATSSLSATGQVSISTNGSTISIGVPNAVTYSRYNEFKESPMVAGEIGNATLHMQPWLVPNLHMDRVVLHKAFSNASNSSFSFTVSDWVGIYTSTGSSLSLLHSVSTSTNFTGSGTVGSYLSYGGGIKAHTLGLTQTLTEGMYWIGVIQRTTTGGGAGHTLNQVLNSQMNSSYRGLMGATNATNQMSLGLGVYTASTSAMPASIAFTQINGNSSVFLRPPSLYFLSGTV